MSPAAGPFQLLFPLEVEAHFLRGGGRILLVSEPSRVHALEEMLRQDGHTVASVGSTAEALRHYEDLQPDLLLLEVELPDGAAVACCRDLAALRDPAAPAVIFLADECDPREMVEGLAAGGIDFLCGPFREAEVLARIRVHLLNRRRLAHLRREDTAKQRLLCMAAHDLRNPLVSIRALTTLLRAETAGPVTSGQRELLDTINDASQSMLDLVNDMLDDSVVASGQMRLTPRPTSLAQLVAASVRLNEATAAQKGSQIVLQPGTLPAMLSLDEPKIRQVLNNLLSNAVKFSPPGSTITVATESTATECLVGVRDQGPGVREEERARLFRAFTRGSAQPTGGESSTGLGLAICHRIVRAHAGAISVHNLPEGGAEFRIALPFAP
jgi:signal transduction histidine kinase